MRHFLIRNIDKSTTNSFLKVLDEKFVNYDVLSFESNTLHLQLSFERKLELQIQAQARWGFRKSIFFGSHGLWYDVFIYLTLSKLPVVFDFEEECLKCLNSNRSIVKEYLLVKEIIVKKIM
jgi:hypothetical protein